MVKGTLATHLASTVTESVARSVGQSSNQSNSGAWPGVIGLTQWTCTENSRGDTSVQDGEISPKPQSPFNGPDTLYRWTISSLVAKRQDHSGMHRMEKCDLIKETNKHKSTFHSCIYWRTMWCCRVANFRIVTTSRFHYFYV